MAVMTYLPAPIKIQNNRINENPDYFLYAGSSIALGILSYYAPKTFVATSVGIFAYQVYRFNQLVQTADATKHQQIHTWAIKACMVMWSIGSVFMIKSLPSFWSAAKDLRHFQLIYCIGHLAKGAIMMLVGICTKEFSLSAKDLAKCRRWVEMEDYVENYPAEVKQELLSRYGRQLVFYISALLPRTGLATFLSKYHFALSQFQSEQSKSSILQTYFRKIHINTHQWPLAIHQLQQLSIEDQKALGPYLSSSVQDRSVEYCSQFPDNVKAIILNETLKGFSNLLHQEWSTFVEAFEKLPKEQQSVLDEELLRLIQTVPLESINEYFSEPMRLQALKASRNFLHIDGMDTLVESIYNGLSEPLQKEYELILQNDNELIRKLYQWKKEEPPKKGGC